MGVNNKAEVDTKSIIECHKAFNDNVSLCPIINIPSHLLSHPFVLSISGGIDSMCLLYNFLIYKKLYNINFSVVNFDHQIREVSSARDSSFVKYFCEQFNIDYTLVLLDTINVSKKNKIGIEQAARELRKDYYYKLIENNNIVTLGHNSDDNIESIFLNIIRGSYLHGLSGMKEFSNCFYRPLLSISRSSIENFVEIHKIPYVFDETNDDNTYSRNFLRNSIIPLLKDKYPSLSSSISSLSENINATLSFLDSKVLKYINFDKNFTSINLDINNEDPFLIQHAISIVFNKTIEMKNYTKRQIMAVTDLFKKDTSSSISLSSNFIAQKTKDCVIFFKKMAKDENIYPFLLDGDYKNLFFKLKKEISYIPSANKLFLDIDKLPNNVIIRTRREKDIFCPYEGKSIPLAKYFTNKKIPLFLRDRLYLIAKDSIVYAIVSLEVSDMVKIDNTTKNIYSIKVVTYEK